MRKLMWFTAGFAGGCGICSYFYTQWTLFFLLGSLILAAVFCILSLKRKRFYLPAAISLGLVAAFGWFMIYEGAFLAEAANLDGKTEALSIAVDDYPYETTYGCAFDGSVDLGNTTVRVRVYLNEWEDLKPGDQVIGKFRCRFTTDGGSQEPLYHRSKGIFLMLYQKGETQITESESLSLKQRTAIWRRNLTEKLYELFPSDVSGIVKALLLGDDSDLSYKTRTAFKVSGISHIIAVSGLHVSILCGVITLMTLRKRWLTAIFGIPVLLLFAALVGFTPSVTRAVVMQILFILSNLVDKEYDPLTSMSFSALVMLILNPLVITSVSLQLSMLCILGILLPSQRLQTWLLDPKRLGRWKRRFPGWFAQSVSISAGTMLFTAPLVAIYFGTVSLVSTLTNLLTLWAVTIAFQGILIVCAFGFWWPAAGSFLAAAVALPIRYVVAVSDFLASLPLSAVYTKSIYAVLWLVLVYGLIVVFVRQKEKTPLLLAGIGILSLCLSVGFSWLEPMLDPYRMTVLDVGQGQAILLQSSGKSYLVDCGGNYGDGAADIAAETLLSQGIDRLDGIILTHLDDDHTNGLPNLLTRIDADVVFLPDVEDAAEFAQQIPGSSVLEAVSEDTFISYDNTIITIFPPMTRESDNENSMCILFQCGNCDILITGDRSQIGERILLANYDLPKLDVLIVGHHGSKTSTGTALLEALRPKYAMISAGENNSYGHPSQVVLERLEEFGCVVYRTDQNGTIVYRG